MESSEIVYRNGKNGKKILYGSVYHRIQLKLTKTDGKKKDIYPTGSFAYTKFKI